MRTCKTDSEIMRNKDWLTVCPERCYFYPGRDCPGWDAGGICGRIGERIPLDAEPPAITHRGHEEPLQFPGHPALAPE
jgi:hypothetical protein